MARGTMYCEDHKSLCLMFDLLGIDPCLFNSTELEAGKRLALQEEKQALEVKLLEVPKLRARLADLKEGRSPIVSPTM